MSSVDQQIQVSLTSCAVQSGLPVGSAASTPSTGQIERRSVASTREAGIHGVTTEHLAMVGARSETRSEQGAKGAGPKGASEINSWAVPTGRAEKFRLWQDDLQHVLKINGQEGIDSFLAVQPPDLDDEPNPESAAAKKRHAELLAAWMKLRAEIYDYLVETLIIDGSR